jgi:hypothetical protein
MGQELLVILKGNLKRLDNGAIVKKKFQMLGLEFIYNDTISYTNVDLIAANEVAIASISKETLE